MTVCPKCKGRATKLFSLSTGLYTCQQCQHEWAAPVELPGPKRWACKSCGRERRRAECLFCGNAEPISDEPRVSGVVR